jgi:hypothetical protein
MVLVSVHNDAMGLALDRSLGGSDRKQAKRPEPVAGRKKNNGVPLHLLCELSSGPIGPHFCSKLFL